jgi:hypothetical protein
MKTQVYKNFLIVQNGETVTVYDYANRKLIGLASERQARDFVDALIIAGLRKKAIKNPLTRAEKKNILAESRVHSKIRKPYYRGMAEGMNDIAKQYSANPEKRKLLPMKERPGYQNIDKYYLRRIGLSDEKIKRLIDLQLDGMTLGQAYHLIESETKSSKNPPRVKVYENIREIVATKGRGHKCDAACRKARHTYIHKFNGSASVYGNPDGTLTIQSNS